jgi:1-acyl-sn-glycerol-3-phosphate acyltransferase
VVQPLFDGAVYVAIKAGVPIVPVGIGGSERVMPKKARFVYPRKVHVEIGEPIPSPKAAPGERLGRHVYKDQSQRLHDELQRLFDEAMRHVPWDYPTDTEYR